MITHDEQVQKFPVGTKIKHKSGEMIYTVLAFAGKNYFVSWTAKEGNEESSSLSAWRISKFYVEYKEPRKVSMWIPVVKIRDNQEIYFSSLSFDTRKQALKYIALPQHDVIDAVEVTYEEKT